MIRPRITDADLAACAHGTEEFGSYCFGKSGGVRWRARWLDLRGSHETTLTETRDVNYQPKERSWKTPSS